MSPFWTFAKRMLRYKALLALSAVMVGVASACLGVGLLGASPVLKTILGDRRGLRDMAVSAWDAAHEKLPALPRPSDAFFDSLPTDPFATLVRLLAALAALTIVGSVANFLYAYSAQTIVNRTVTNLRREAFARVLRAPLRDILAAGPTDAISRIVNDSTQVSTGLSMVLSKAIIQVFKGIAALIAAFVLSTWITLGALLVAPLLYLVIRRVGKRIKRASNAALVSQAGLYATAAEAMQALRVVKVHTTELYESGRFHRVNKDMLRELNRVRTSKALASPLTEALTLFVLCGLVILIGHFVLHRNLPAENFLLVIAFLGVAGASLKPLTGIINDVQSAEPAAARLKQLMDEPVEPGHERGLPHLPRHRLAIELRGVTFTYPGAHRPALSNVSITIPHGTRVAIVGPNGSGKTTLLALLPRLFDPDAGRVLIDGQDIRDAGVRSLRRQMAMVTQEVVLFRGTLRSNIAYGSFPSDEQIIAAATKARAHEFISTLPLGYDTPVTEQGASLSGGQRQRVAIARAILRDPAILILDEATSMVDAESESKIAAALVEFALGRTCLIVAHRLSTVMNADSIIVMDQGRVVDQGRHEELLTRCTVYRSLAQHFGGV